MDLQTSYILYTYSVQYTLLVDYNEYMYIYPYNKIVLDSIIAADEIRYIAESISTIKYTKSEEKIHYICTVYCFMCSVDVDE